MRSFALKVVFIILVIKGVAFSEEAPFIKEIAFKGLKRVQEAFLKARLTQHVGEPLNYESISDDIKNIYRLGYFEDVRAEIEPLEDGIKLIYIVIEKPLILRVDFQGNKEVDDSRLKEAITIPPGSPADIIVIQENVDKIKRLYEKEGYPLARIVPILRRISPQNVLLTYQIEELNKVRIREITIIGNKAISEEKIKHTMKTSEWWLFSFITGSGKYESSELTSDIDAIKDLYLDNGFLKVDVKAPQTKLSENKKWMDITIEISEDEQYKVSAIELSGNKVFSEKELREKLKSSVGSPISRKTLRSDVATLTELHTEKGYAMAGVYPDVVPDEAKKEAKVIFRVREGDIFSIGRIEISGNQKTRDKVIRREIRLNEGDRFNSKLLRRSYQNVNNLNLFETLNISPYPDPKNKIVNLSIDVKERPSGFLSVGAGYSSIDRLVGMIDVTQGNLGGRGQHIKLKTEFGSRFNSYEFSFRDPWFLNKPVSFTTGIYTSMREYVNYTKRSSGFMLGFGFRLSDYWRTNISYNYERAVIYDIKETASAAIREQEGERITSSISPSIARDSRDNFLDPHRGSRNAIYFTYAGIGGDNKFFKTALESSWFFPVSERTTFAIMGTWGYAKGIYGRKLPIYERFYVGGIYSLRGFGFGEAGPRDEKGAVIGGTKKVIFNAEYTFPLIEEARLKGVIFYDTGAAYDSTSDLRLRQSGGVGIRWISPIGPLRLEWGRNLDPRPGERRGRWEFAFGTFF